jgi:hypothetical protein
LQINERSASSVRDRYSNDPAFTEDVRHLALPARRNSGPESEQFKMFGKKKSKSKEEGSSHYSLRMERKKKSQANNHSAEYLCKNTSSSESLDNIISSYKLKGRKGFSLDRNFDVDAKPQMKPKRSSWFLRDKNRDKQSKSEKFLKRSSLDFSVTFDARQFDRPTKLKAKTIYRQNAADYTGDSSTTPQEEVPEPMKKLSKFQIGKRFLKGEIGIRSFNYYLLKEGLKKNHGKQKQDSVSSGGGTTKPVYMSKSEENIYEEIFFHHDQQITKANAQAVLPPALPPLNKQTSVSATQLKQTTQSDGGCLNCEICIIEAQEKRHTMCSSQSCDKCVEGHRQQNLMTNSLSGSESYAKVTRKLDNKAIYDFFQQQSQGQTVLQFQSYNPSNPSVYKIETTPVAFEYDPLEEQIYQLEHGQQEIYIQQKLKSFSGDGVIAKSSSSSDSLKGQLNQRHSHQLPQAPSEFYTRPNYFYPSSNEQLQQHHQHSQHQHNQQQQQQHSNNRKSMYKTDSSNSLRSENSLNKIYNSKNSSQKSSQSNHNRDEMQIRQDMSDSSLGDSLFSSDANKRYFGSSESCRFNYECGRRRCSLENEKCSFSDTCRYECNLRNCDCSSSYFSSDFDDTNVYTTNNNISSNNNNSNNRAIKSHHNNQQGVDYQYSVVDQTKSTHYAEDFIKHVSNVKRRSQNVPFDGGSNVVLTSSQITTSIYEVPKANPKRLDVDVAGLRGNLNDPNETNSNDKLIADEMATITNRKMLTQSENNKISQLSPAQAKSNMISTGTVPKLSISSNDSKKSSTRSSQKHGKQCRNQANDNLESSLKVTQGNENLLSSEPQLSPSHSENKIAVVHEKKMPIGTKADSDAQKAAPTNKSEHTKPSNAAEDYEEDDEVFIDTTKANEKSSSAVVADKKVSVSLIAFFSLSSFYYVLACVNVKIGFFTFSFCCHLVKMGIGM